MVGPDGLEPSTPRLSSACSNQLSYEPSFKENNHTPFGGADRTRTGDILLAKQALYQLSYDPSLVDSYLCLFKEPSLVWPLEIYFVRSTGTHALSGTSTMEATKTCVSSLPSP
jgi:hypothetical protein